MERLSDYCICIYVHIYNMDLKESLIKENLYNSN